MSYRPNIICCEDSYFLLKRQKNVAGGWRHCGGDGLFFLVPVVVDFDSEDYHGADSGDDVGDCKRPV